MAKSLAETFRDNANSFNKHKEEAAAAKLKAERDRQKAEEAKRQKWHDDFVSSQSAVWYDAIIDYARARSLEGAIDVWIQTATASEFRDRVETGFYGFPNLAGISWYGSRLRDDDEEQIAYVDTLNELVRLLRQDRFNVSEAHYDVASGITLRFTF